MRLMERPLAGQGQGFALDLIALKIVRFPKAVGLWWVQGKALALPDLGPLVTRGRG